MILKIHHNIYIRLRQVAWLVAALMLVAGLAACSSDDEFVVRGTVEGNPTMNLRVVYNGSRGMQSLVTAVREGKFEFSGKSSQPVLLEIFDNDYRILGRVYTVNGQTIESRLDRSNPYLQQAKGSKLMESWTDWMRRNADGLKSGRREANTLVADYVRDHPEDLVSTLLMLSVFDARGNELQADSLMASIAPSARPSNLVQGFNYLLEGLVTAQAIGPMETVHYYHSRDSIATFNPSDAAFSLLAVGTTFDGRDSIVPVLRRLDKQKGRGRLQVMDLSVDNDTMTWRRNVIPDSATWAQGWIYGSVSAADLRVLGISGLPYFIVTDSTGEQLYRGRSILAAEAKIDSLLK